MDPLQFFLIKNNVKTHEINILKDLTNLKNLYSRQLAKMPREYIVKLLFDTVHESLIVKMGQKIVAGVTFRGFKDRPFYQIAFLAVNKEDQCTGLGSKVMNKFKNHCQSQEIEHVFTFADDGAIGFFQRHGFSKQTSLQNKQYQAYIKEYIGGQLMECKFNLQLKVDFQKLKDQIREVQNHIVDKKIKPLIGLAAYEIKVASDILRQKEIKHKSLEELCEFIPGLKEAGYSKEQQKKNQQRLKLPFLLHCQQFIQLAYSKSSLLKDVLEYDEMRKLVQTVQNMNKENILKDFYFLLYTMERKLRFGHYRYKDEFIEDFTDMLKGILHLDGDLRPNEKEFLVKINQLKYDFMKNLLPQEKLKAKSIELPKS